MTIFLIKIIAVLAMLIDHIGNIFGEKWGMLPVESMVFRSIGRISYPLFAFCIVNGWRHTRCKKAYFLNILLCAIFSQIPYTLTFYYTNSIPLNYLFTTAFLQQFIWERLPVAILCVTVYWYFIENKKFSFSLIIVAAACLLPCFLLHINHTWILADELNVLYTFALGFVIFYVLDTLKRRSFKWYERGILVVVSILAVLAYGMKADYGTCLIGLLLLVSLYLCNGSKAAESICILAWGILSYGIVISNKYYLISVLFAVIPVMLYNQKLGKSNKAIKFLFYLFYPLHLLVIGLCNIYIRFYV